MGQSVKGTDWHEMGKCWGLHSSWVAVHTNRKSVDVHRDILLLNGACKPNTRAVQSPASQTHAAYFRSVGFPPERRQPHLLLCRVWGHDRRLWEPKHLWRNDRQNLSTQPPESVLAGKPEPFCTGVMVFRRASAELGAGGGSWCERDGEALAVMVRGLPESSSN